MVVAVKMNRKRLVVMLEEVIFIYDISNMKMLHQQLTPLNPGGIIALSSNSENNYLALPHYQKSVAPTHAAASHVPKSMVKEPISGDVLLYDLNRMEEVLVIPAHQTPLSHVAINSDGTMLATASEKGTVIRIFGIPDGRKLFQFRRGSMPARIYCMTFNATSTLLCVSSATETVHMFKLSAPTKAPGTSSDDRPLSPPGSPLDARSGQRDRSVSSSRTSDETNDPSAEGDGATHGRQPRQPGFMSLLRRTSQGVSTSLVTRAAGYLPSSVTELWEPQRDFAWLRVPRSTSGAPVRCVVALAHHAPQVLVATSEGDFYVYSVDLEKGGEGTLVKRYE